MEKSRLEVRISPKLKQDFEDMCREREISISDHVRDLMTNSVRNFKRQSGKGTEKEV